MLNKVEYLGHKITSQGLKPTDKKNLDNHPGSAPSNVLQLKFFDPGKFLPNLSTCLSPLYNLV